MPDSKTVWLFKEQLRKAGLVKELFEQFASYLNGAGYPAQCGQIVDATLVPVPKQHNSKSENEQAKRGEVPED